MPRPSPGGARGPLRPGTQIRPKGRFGSRAVVASPRENGRFVRSAAVGRNRSQCRLRGFSCLMRRSELCHDRSFRFEASQAKKSPYRRQCWTLAPGPVNSQYLDLDSASEASMSQFIRRQHIRVLVLCGIVVSLQVGGSADHKPQQTQRTASSPNVVQCTEPRPQICTQEYIPVCANLRDGTKRTYPSGCVACSDANVVSYRPNRCE
jgi:hypothetical protein